MKHTFFVLSLRSLLIHFFWLKQIKISELKRQFSNRKYFCHDICSVSALQELKKKPLFCRCAVHCDAIPKSTTQHRAGEASANSVTNRINSDENAVISPEQNPCSSREKHQIHSKGGNPTIFRTYMLQGEQDYRNKKVLIK